MLSGGRLGVKSRVGFGSTFWVEMPFGVGPQTRRTDFQDAGRRIGNSMTPGSESSVGSATRESKKLLATSDYELDDSGITVIGDEKGGIELGPIGAFRLSSPPRQDKTSTNDRLVRPDAHTTMSSVSAPAAVAPAADQTLKAKNAKLEFADGPVRFSPLNSTPFLSKLPTYICLLPEQLRVLIGTFSVSFPQVLFPDFFLALS